MPYTGIVLAILAAFFAAFLILISHWVVSAGLFPRAVEKLADTYGSRPIRAALIGIFTYGPIQFLSLNAGKIQNGPLKFLVIIGGFATLLMALIGTSGLALRIGRNLAPTSEPWKQVLRGGVMLALVFITPLLGWFFMLPVGLASGFGAFLMSKPWKRAAKVAVAPIAAPVVEALPATPIQTSEPVVVAEPAPVAVAEPALS